MRSNNKIAAYEYLKNKIVTNEYPFGSAIIEQNVADDLDMSRTPVREAIKQLEAEGLLVCYPFQGTFVSNLPFDHIEEMCGIRAALESFCLEKSIFRFTDAELDEFMKGFRESIEDAEEYNRVDARFHKVIVEKSGYQKAGEFIESVNVQIERFKNASKGRFRSRREASLNEHMEIIELIRARNIVACKMKLKEHLSNVAEYFNGGNS